MDPIRGKHVRGPPTPTRGNFRVPRRVDTQQYYIPDPPPTTQPQQVDRSQYYIPDPTPTTQPQYHYASQSHTSYFPPPTRAMHPPPPRAMIPPPSTRVQDYEWYQTAEIDLESFDPFDRTTNPPPPTRSRPPTPLPTDDEDEAIPDTQEVQIGSNNDDATVLPDLNESSTPSSRPRKGRKIVGSSSSKGGRFFPAFTEEYTEKKKQNMEEANMKKQTLLDLQLEHQSNKTKRSDYKFFNTPHANSDPKSREWAIEQKREIAAKYG
uniref:pollen-specific leucine-rich repeat extensin-like protein 2 n=1 Tax=Erigeron canadensis TaxID=72917 RepID=UPI001CB9BF04|nr:pollen-specific leucine-rich repeat extensin-like protein 2 [Erigeron canadensis]